MRVVDENSGEKTSGHRVTFEGVVANLATKFINLKLTEIDVGIQEALETIGCFAEVDRSYIFQFSSDRRSISNCYEWCAGGIDSHIDELQDLICGCVSMDHAPIPEG